MFICIFLKVSQFGQLYWIRRCFFFYYFIGRSILFKNLIPVDSKSYFSINHLTAWIMLVKLSSFRNNYDLSIISFKLRWDRWTVFANHLVRLLSIGDRPHSNLTKSLDESCLAEPFLVELSRITKSLQIKLFLIKSLDRVLNLDKFFWPNSYFLKATLSIFILWHSFFLF